MSHFQCSKAGEKLVLSEKVNNCLRISFLGWFGGFDCSMHRAESGAKGVDVVHDPVGGKSFEEALKVVKWGAQILIIGFASGGIPKVRHIDLDVTLISQKPFLGCLFTIA